MSTLPPIRVLELFAGSRSIGKVAERMGMKVRSVDVVPYPGVDTVVDLLSVPIRRWRDWQPDIIWASPPCTGFSVASIGRHWGGGKDAYQPKSSTALLGMALVRRTQEIIEACGGNDIVWFMENPRGVLRKLPVMNDWLATSGCSSTHATVSYCQYGDDRMKPTDIWTNCHRWKPKRMCRNGATCHEAAPRGSRTGTQGRDGAHSRSTIPTRLCGAVLRAAVRQLNEMRHAA